MSRILPLSFTILYTTVAQLTAPQLQKAVTSPLSPLSPDFPIPGGSPLRYCTESRPTDLYSIDRIELWPQPLYIDDVFEVHLYGTFSQNLTVNATWTFTARHADTPGNETGTWAFCDVPDSIEQPVPGRKTHCPPQQGVALIMMSGLVMRLFIGPGDYYFKFDAVTKEGERIYCLEANMHFDFKDSGIQSWEDVRQLE